MTGNEQQGEADLIAPVYPSLIEPAIGSGETTEIAPGVLWVRMPLVGKLSAINIWALADGDGWSVVDTGIRSAETETAWHLLGAKAMENRPIKRVIVTHLHPDHAGMAGWLTNLFGARLWMTPLEYFTLHMLMQDAGRSPPPEAIQFYRSAGMNEDWIDDYRTRFGEFGSRIYPLPAQFRALRAGERVTIGAHEWICVIGQGHSPEHACLYAPKLKLFIAGDQVLPTISSNVSVYPYEPEADPLTSWLTSLAQIRASVPDDVLVLPAHGRPYKGLHARIDKLTRGHEAALERLLGVLREPHSASELFGALFRNVGTDHAVLRMAIGEAIAHLACLGTRGRAGSTSDPDGIIRWHRTSR